MSETRAASSTATQLRLLFAHWSDKFYSVEWSPDRHMIATGSENSTIRLWDATSGQILRTLTGHREGVASVAWSGDGHWLASGSYDRTVRMWEAASGRHLRTLKRYQDWVTSVAWSRDGRWLASSSGDRTVRVSSGLFSPITPVGDMDVVVKITHYRTLLVTTLQDRSQLAYMRYRGGVDTLLNALDADRDLCNAELSLTQKERNELLALVQLYKALGGGWQP